MRGSPVVMLNFIQICSYIIEKIPENCQKRPNLGTQPVMGKHQLSTHNHQLHVYCDINDMVSGT